MPVRDVRFVLLRKTLIEVAHFIRNSCKVLITSLNEDISLSLFCGSFDDSPLQAVNVSFILC